MSTFTFSPGSVSRYLETASHLPAHRVAWAHALADYSVLRDGVADLLATHPPGMATPQPLTDEAKAVLVWSLVSDSEFAEAVVSVLEPLIVPKLEAAAALLSKGGDAK